MRKPIALIATLVLAAALAAGAGDGIKWEQEKNLVYAPVELPPESFNEDFGKVADKLTLKWRAPHGNDFNYIQATYFDWRLYCAHLQTTIKDNPNKLKRMNAAAADARERYRGKFRFFVTLATRRIEWGRLTNKYFWEVYLDVDGEKVTAAEMEPMEGSNDTSARFFVSHGLVASAAHYYANKSYLITFENPGGDATPKSLKLVLLCEKARRGFEWRFKE